MEKKFSIPYTPSSHEVNFIEYFGEHGLRLNQRGLPVGLTTYIICFTNRCGSNFLAELIRTNPALGKAGEYLNFPAVLGVSERKKFRSLQQYLLWIIQAKSSDQGIFGIKLDYKQLFFLYKAGLLPYLFGQVQFIHIYRINVLAQAVSHVIASQNKEWTSNQQCKLENNQIVFNGEQIVKVMDNIHEANSKFRCFFDLYDIRPIVLTYEELIEDPARVGINVIRQLNFSEVKELSVNLNAVNLKKQENNLKKEFILKMREKYHFY